MSENIFKTELDYELKKFNKESEVKKINEKFEKEVTAITLTPPMFDSGDLAFAPMPDPALIQIQIEHRKILADFAKNNGYNLVYQYLTKND